jgi:UDP-glucose 4-epimerase
MARIFITGAAGFIGSHTADQLLAAGHEVLGIDNLRTGKRENLAAAGQHPTFSFEEADVRDAGRMYEAVRGFCPDAIIHLAAVVSVQECIEKPALNFDVNVGATKVIAEAARLAKVARIVFASSAAVYGDASTPPLGESDPSSPASPYGWAKSASESLLTLFAEYYQLHPVIFRYFNVYGPRQDPSSPYSGVISVFNRRMAARNAVTIYGDGEQTRDFVSVRDVARANLIAATRESIPAGCYNIATGRARSLNQIHDILREIYPDAPPPAFAPSRQGDIRYSCGDPSKTRAALGFSAEVSLEEGLQELAAI